MGADIHVRAVERMVDGRWEEVEVDVFGYRDYAVFGFLADVRNYSMAPVIRPPRGIPDDAHHGIRVEYEGDPEMGIDRYVDFHSWTWFTVQELLDYDYDQVMENRRCTAKLPNGVISGSAVCEPGDGSFVTVREHLGESYFHDLDKLKEAGAERIIICFDN